MARRYSMGARRRQNFDVHPPHETAPPERWQHADGFTLVTDCEEGTVAARVLNECALDRWLCVGAIHETEHAAGLRFKQDYLSGQVQQRITRLYIPMSTQKTSSQWSSAAEKRCEESEAAYRRWREAVRVLGTAYSAIVLAVACEDRAVAWGQRHHLRLGLSRLCDYYRIPKGNVFE